ncbi:MAG: SDR family oxidoreductase [Patescibacteria group bacterium]|jgi:dTDP-4-dehydrorhamnose reductase
MSFAIFCTGSSGLVASGFSHITGVKSIPFYGFDLHGNEESVDILNPDNLLRNVQKKLSEAAAQKIQPVMFHFAAATMTGFDLTPEQINLSWELNVDGTQNVLEVCKQLAIPCVHISTDYVFSGGQKETSYFPGDVLTPDETVYSQTKARAEELVMESSSSQSVAIVRIAFPYGNNEHPKRGLVRKMVEWMDTKPQVVLYGDQRISPSPIRLIGEGCLILAELLANKKITSGNIFHLVGKPTTPFEFGSMVKEIYGKNTPLVQTSINSSGPKNLVLDTKKTEEMLGITVLDHKEEIQKMFSS